MRAPPHTVSGNQLSLINRLYINSESLRIQRVMYKNVFIALGVRKNFLN